MAKGQLRGQQETGRGRLTIVAHGVEVEALQVGEHEGISGEVPCPVAHGHGVGAVARSTWCRELARCRRGHGGDRGEEPGTGAWASFGSVETGEAAAIGMRMTRSGTTRLGRLPRTNSWAAEGDHVLQLQRTSLVSTQKTKCFCIDECEMVALAARCRIWGQQGKLASLRGVTELMLARSPPVGVEHS